MSRAGVGLAAPEGTGRGPCVPATPALGPPAPGDRSAQQLEGRSPCPREASPTGPLIPCWPLSGQKAGEVKGACGVGSTWR